MSSSFLNNESNALAPSVRLEEEQDQIQSCQILLKPTDAHKVTPLNFWLQTLYLQSGQVGAITFQIPADAFGLPFTHLMEVQRQAGIAFAHRALGVSQSEAFVLKSMNLSRREHGLDLTSTGMIQIATANSRFVGTTLKQTEVLSEIQNANGDAIFDGSLASSFVKKEVFERIRKRSVGTPSNVNKCDVCGNTNTEGFLIDTRASRLRDHDSDHLAAIEIIAAIEEGIISNFSSRISGLSISFENYVELSPHPVMHFFPTATNLIAGCIHQDQTLSATFLVETTKSGKPNDQN